MSIMASVTLTIRELIEICEFMGMPEGSKDNWYEMMDEYEEEDLVIINQSFKGVEVFDEESGKTEKYRIVVACDGCEFNEVEPIGEPIDE